VTAELGETRHSPGAATVQNAPRYTARLVMACADRPGIVAAVSAFLFECGANIVSSQQYSTGPSGGRFFLRTEFFLEDVPERERFEDRFGAEVAGHFEMDWRIRWWGEHQRLAILVSRQDHCLLDLLWRSRRGELDGEVVMVISNHRDLERETTAYGLPFHHVAVEPRSKERAEEAMLQLLGGRAELLVLARYMQILSDGFLERVEMPAINIHHSFLPAFAGADPYRRAHEQGVKLVGATAHYVTEQLDDGPIIDQDVVRVDHRDGAADLERVGRDVERLVLARAVSLHLDDRVIVDGRRTIVF
jgi:formyltetrahydrofolate deformylase